MILSRSFTRQPLRLARCCQIRSVSTLEGNPHIVSSAARLQSVCRFSSSQLQYVFPNKPQGGSHTLSLLSSEPVNPKTAIGVTSKLPPSTDSFRENPDFLKILQEVISEYGHQDPDAISQAQVMVSTAGANIGAGGVLTTGQGGRRRRESKDSSGGASGQGGVGSAGRGGWIHLSDSRRPPEFGRIAW